MAQSGPAQPARHWQEPSVQMPWPEQKLRSSQESIGCTVSDRHILQHCAGPIGTNSPVRVILHQNIFLTFPFCMTLAHH